VEDVNKVVDQCRNLIANGKQFAVLMPVSIAGEVARLENTGRERHYDEDLLKKVEGLSRIILAQDAEMWLVNLNNHRFNEFVPIHQQGTDDAQSHETVQWTIDKFRSNKANQCILEDNNANKPDRARIRAPSCCQSPDRREASTMERIQKSDQVGSPKEFQV